MSTVILVCVAAGLLTLVLVGTAFWYFKSRVKQLRQALNLLREVELELRRTNQEKHARIEQLEAKHKRTHELFKLHSEKNQEFERQRNQIWEIYRRAGLEAGNAQSMLMRELQLTLLKLNNYKKKAGEKPEEVNPEIQQIVSRFLEQHGADRPEELRLDE